LAMSEIVREERINIPMRDGVLLAASADAEPV
jgi:predicted acyl esterase